MPCLLVNILVQGGEGLKEGHLLICAQRALLAGSSSPGVDQAGESKLGVSAFKVCFGGRMDRTVGGVDVEV